MPTTRRGRQAAGRKTGSGATRRRNSVGRSARPGGWRLKPHHRHHIGAALLLLLSLLLAASLTALRSAPFLEQLADAALGAFGLSAYLLSAGLIVISIAHLVESPKRRRTVRWKLVCGVLLLWFALLMELQLLLGGTRAAVIAPFGTFPATLVRSALPALPAFWWEVFFLLLLASDLVVAFGLRFTHVARGFRAAGAITGMRARRPKAVSAPVRQPSPFLGQRPRYSRYGSAQVPNSANRNVSPQGGQVQASQSAQTFPGRLENPNCQLAAGADEDTSVDVASDCGTHTSDDEDDDPLNERTMCHQQIRRMPRGPRQSVNLLEHQAVVQGAQAHQQRNKGAKAQQDMEPLAPNPWLNNKGPVTPRIPVAESSWIIPDTSLLNRPEEVKLQMLGDDTATLAKTIQDTLRSFKVDAEVRQEDISIGPTVIRFGIRPTGKPEMKIDEKTGKYVPVHDAGGNIVYQTRTRVSRIMALQNDFALVLEARTIRMSAPVPGQPYVGVEIPNKQSHLVTLREVLESREFRAAKARSTLAFALGRDVAGAVRVGDLARMPHLLIAGATGSGKSVLLNALIGSLLTQSTPEDVRFLMVDPKMVELNMYGGIPHLLAPVVTEVEKVVPLLKNGITEMERRYRLFSQLGVRNLDGYRKLRAEKLAHSDSSLKNLPAIVIIIDELADLMMAASEEVEGMICRLAQLARATGIHLVIATQRPSVDVITGLIKANIPTRISFMVSSAVDSRTIIDQGGAERLLGRGDMLYLPADAGCPERIQGCFLADEEAEYLVTYWRQQVLEHSMQSGAPSVPAALPTKVEPGWEITEQPSDDLTLDDDLLDRAQEVVREYEKASISLLQRRLRIGYSRAARLIDLLEERGVIGPAAGGSGLRAVSGGRAEGDAPDILEGRAI
jgi:DNA segregation ATPase FtsK/SpoIIIE-like protein